MNDEPIPEVEYPDLTEIYDRKERARQAEAQLSLGEKIIMIERMMDDLAVFDSAREEWRQENVKRTAHLWSRIERDPSR